MFRNVRMPLTYWEWEYDGAPLDKAVGPIGWRSFTDGTHQTIEDFRHAIAGGRLDVDRAIA